MINYLWFSAHTFDSSWLNQQTVVITTNTKLINLTSLRFIRSSLFQNSFGIVSIFSLFFCPFLKSQFFFRIWEKKESGGRLRTVIYVRLVVAPERSRIGIWQRIDESGQSHRRIVELRTHKRRKNIQTLLSLVLVTNLLVIHYTQKETTLHTAQNQSFNDNLFSLFRTRLKKTKNVPHTKIETPTGKNPESFSLSFFSLAKPIQSIATYKFWW